MAQNRIDFKAAVSASIFTNIYKLIKGNTVRDKFLVLADSVPFLDPLNGLMDPAQINGWNNKADRASQLLTPATTPYSVGEFGGGNGRDIRVVATTFYIAGAGNFLAPQTDFLNIANCASGNLKSVGLFGTTSNTVIKVEGPEGPGATAPATPPNSFVIDYIVWGDAGALGSMPPPSASVVTTITSSATPTVVIDAATDKTDWLIMTGLAVNASFVFPPVVDRKNIRVRYKDNGTSRNFTFPPNVHASPDLPLPPATTVNKWGELGFTGHALLNKWVLMASIDKL